MQGHNLWSKPKIYGVLVQWIQYNEFVDNGLKNWVLMSWTTASFKSCDDQTQSKDTYLSELPIRGG